MSKNTGMAQKQAKHAETAQKQAKKPLKPPKNEQNEPEVPQNGVKRQRKIQRGAQGPQTLRKVPDPWEANERRRGLGGAAPEALGAAAESLDLGFPRRKTRCPTTRP